MVNRKLDKFPPTPTLLLFNSLYAISSYSLTLIKLGISPRQVRKNVLDVSYHVSQYQTIISELRGEIGRLKEKIQTEGGHLQGNSSGPGAKKAAEELKELRDQMVANFKDQMNLRLVLFSIFG